MHLHCCTFYTAAFPPLPECTVPVRIQPGSKPGGDKTGTYVFGFVIGLDLHKCRSYLNWQAVFLRLFDFASEAVPRN